MDSVLGQDYPDLEYIVIDGGSSDGTVAIIEHRAERLAYWVSEPDEGQTDAICKGFGRATGDVLAWLNADDCYLPGALAQIAAAFEADPEADIVYGYCDLVDEAGRAIMTRRDIDFDHWQALFGVGPILQPEAFVRRRMVDRVGPPRRDLHMIMDKEWWLRMSAAGARFKRIDRKIVAFRVHPDATSSKLYDVAVAENHDLRRRYWTRFRPRNPAIERVAVFALLQYFRLVRQVRLIRTYGRPMLTLPALKHRAPVAEKRKLSHSA